MKKLSFKFAIQLITLLLVSTFTTPAFSQVTGSIDATPADAEYKHLTVELGKKINKLEELGAGVKPFQTRLKAIDESYTASNDAQAALKQLNSLSRAADDQLKNLTALRSPARKVERAKTRMALSGRQSMVPESILKDRKVRQAIMQYAQSKAPAAAKSKKSYSGFNGSADDYVSMVARDVITRELGGLELPVKGPFMLERFRNVQRISELRKQGKRINGWLGYHRTTEKIAAAASMDSGRVAELSQRVRYLRKQLGLAPLSSSLRISHYQ